MSAAARRMMEKYGWKEGQGLGREREGIKSYVKVVRRDPHLATGLGHAADPNTSDGLHATTQSVELDALYGDLAQRRSAVAPLQGSQAASSSSSDGDSEEASKPPRRTSSSDSSTSDSEKGDVLVTKMSDAELFKRCGGVRLGRAGRHRLFEGKLARIEKSHTTRSG